MDTQTIGEFIGIFAGDGNYCRDNSYHHQVRIYININDTAYISEVKQIIFAVSKKSPFINERPAYNVTVLRVNSINFVELIRTYLNWGHTKTRTVRLAKSPDSYSNNFAKGFLRGLMDTDGSLSKTRAIYSTISSGLATNISDLLTRFRIEHEIYMQIDGRGNRKPIFRIVIRKDIVSFIRIVRPKHFNYLRSN